MGQGQSGGAGFPGQAPGAEKKKEVRGLQKEWKQLAEKTNASFRAIDPFDASLSLSLSLSLSSNGSSSFLRSALSLSLFFHATRAATRRLVLLAEGDRERKIMRGRERR